VTAADEQGKGGSKAQDQDGDGADYQAGRVFGF